LFVARADDGKAPIHKRSVSITSLVSEACQDFANIAGERNIQLIQNYSDQEFIVNADASKIKQVVTILLDNAVRYSYDNSTIEIRIRTENENIIIEIVDSGIGLKYNEVSQIFSRFYRGAEGSGKAAGTGLGLPVAKAIMKAHGGSIDLQAEEVQGTSASIKLPFEMQLRGVT